MTEREVTIKRIEPMRVARFHAFGKSPEMDCINKMLAWAKPKGLINDANTHRVFGFNNPNPSPDKSEYGYDLLIEIGDELEPEEGIKIEEFSGGLYAVTQVNSIPDIGPGWQFLNDWTKENNYKCGEHQWVEEHVGLYDTSKLTLDLCYPIDDTHR